MATPLVTGNATADASQFTTAEIQPTAGALILAFVSSVRRPLTAVTLSTPTLSSPGLTWDVVNTVATDDNERRLTCLRARGPAPALGAVVISFADQIQEMCAWSVVEYTDTDDTGINGSGAVGFSTPVKGTGTQLDATFTPADAGRDRTIAAIMLQSTGSTARPVTPGAGFTEIHEQTPGETLGKALTLQTQDAAPGVTTVGWTWTGTQSAAALIVGIKAAHVGGPLTGNPAIDIGRRYEPILHLHPAESFVPVNAKRYVEAAALWAAKAPFDNKNNWGTTPLVKAGALSAVPGEPDTSYLGQQNNLVADATNERFLEVGGWKNRDEVPEPGVTGASTNPYVDHAEILRRYGTDLADSRFWYHVELFDTARLRTLARSVKTGFDLTATLANFANPILLCYYFFYPAHEQSVGTDACPNIEAREFASHAGDWQCFALLLDGQGPPSVDQYTPLFFGVTGSRPAPDATNGTFRPHAFDLEGRLALKVEPWRKGSASAPVQPDVVDGHPQFYVARGTHSMYTTPGAQEVSPYEDSKVPAGCGRYDSPSAVPPASPGTPDIPGKRDSFTENGWVIIAVKMRAGFVLGPIGALVGLVAGIIEGIPKAFAPFAAGGTPPSTPPGVDPPNPDAAPATAGQGITVRPKDLAIAGVADNLFDWVSDQGITSPSGRTYDFVVDRATQIWWPSDDGTKGYRGRWGQRVASDPVPHRAGVKFPDFWRMFLTALEQGFGDGKLPRP